MSFHAYQCTCVAGFANGVCEYENIAAYDLLCAVMESEDNADDPVMSGNCDITVRECDSSPCQNGAECADSSTADADVANNAYRCTCVAGFANGVCEYDGDARDRSDPPYGFIVEYASECDVQESNGPDGRWSHDTSSGGRHAASGWQL